MSINIRINIDLTPWQKKLVRSAVVAGAVIAALGIGIAIAGTPIDTTWVVQGQPLTAAQLKTDLDGLQSQITAIGGTATPGRFVTTLNGHHYSVGATSFCGTAPATNGNMGGYAGAKAMCEASVACGTSNSAHMCTAEEIARSAQIGTTPTFAQLLSSQAPGYGWYASGVWANGAAQANDCQGWTSSQTQTSALGTAWAAKCPQNAAVACTADSDCSYSQLVLCCD